MAGRFLFHFPHSCYLVFLSIPDLQSRLEHCSPKVPFAAFPNQNTRDAREFFCAPLEAQDSGFFSAAFFRHCAWELQTFTPESPDFIGSRLPPNCVDREHFRSLGKSLGGSYLFQLLVFCFLSEHSAKQIISKKFSQHC